MHDGSRTRQAVRRVQYELPGFCAGAVMARLDHAVRMIGLGRQEEALADLARASEEAREWQRWAALVVDYDAAHEALRREAV